MKQKELAFVVFILLVAAVSITLKAWVFDWDWRCVVTECRIIKELP